MCICLCTCTVHAYASVRESVCRHGQMKCEYTEERATAYAQSLSFLDWARNLDVEEEALDRVIELRAARPVLQAG